MHSVIAKTQWGKNRQQFNLVAQNPGSSDDSENQGRAQLQRVEEKISENTVRANGGSSC